jgi:GT2 family glycosyltransferase
MADATPLASVVVAVKGDRRVRRLVDSLLRQTFPPTAYEIIVVENGSSILADVATQAEGRVRYLHVAKANTAVARNIGLHSALGRYLLLTDADCVAASDWVEQMVARLATGDVAAAGGAIDKYRPATLTQRYGMTVVNGQRRLSYLPALPLPYVASANAGYLTAAVRDVGGFDPDLRSGSDVDICYRLGLRGYPIALVPTAVVLHEDRASVGEHFRRFHHYAVYQVLLFAKYKQISGRRLVLNPYPLRRIATVVATIPRAVLGLMCGDRGPAAVLGLQLVEAAGVWCGDIRGSLRYRQLYL